MKKILLTLIIVTILASALFYFRNNKNAEGQNSINVIKENVGQKIEEKIVESVNNLNPLSIEYMRKQNYPGSEIKLEQTLQNGTNYKRYVVSYLSEGYKIYALLTVPTTQMPSGGFPVVIFNHGYIPSKEYRTTEKYVAYQDAFAKAGYVTLKSDYRGHGQSEGEAMGGYGSPAYTTDVINAVSSIKELKDFTNTNLIVNKEKIGMWGHSMGGLYYFT